MGGDDRLPGQRGHDSVVVRGVATLRFSGRNVTAVAVEGGDDICRALNVSVKAAFRGNTKHTFIGWLYWQEGFGSEVGYQHVMLPRELSKQVPKTHLMSEEEWRRLGVQQSLGWVHYMIHEPEPHILLFRRPLPKEQQK
ncbi:cyclin-dependent kinases regulatory subunit 2 [Puma concolor]|uniref:Cyclin-dependent kinases regulatory subunit n=1 Tax=Puma concolor TaxID=9696 RepID=A0A6P6IK02_PUMCO|nr:cyclin-dependent kinases regulatory subunit 2 [Puma concolor]